MVTTLYPGEPRTDSLKLLEPIWDCLDVIFIIIWLTRLLLCDLESEPFYGVEVTPALGVAGVHDHPQHSARAQTVHQEARSPRALVGAQPLARQVVHLQVEDLRLTAVEPLLAVDLQGLGRLVGHRAVQRGVRVPCNQFTDFILWLNSTRLRSSGLDWSTLMCRGYLSSG